MNRYRLKDIETTMRREDVELVKLSAALAAEQDPAKQAEIKKAMKVREGKILPIFQQIAVQFADLHDTPGRMAAAGVIKQQVDVPRVACGERTYTETETCCRKDTAAQMCTHTCMR